MRQLVVKLLDTRNLIVVVSSLWKNLASFLSLCTFLSLSSLEFLSFVPTLLLSSPLPPSHLFWMKQTSVSTSVRLWSIEWENARAERKKVRGKWLAISRGQSQKSRPELVVFFSRFAGLSLYECDSE